MSHARTLDLLGERFGNTVVNQVSDRIAIQGSSARGVPCGLMKSGRATPIKTTPSKGKEEMDRLDCSSKER